MKYTYTSVPLKDKFTKKTLWQSLILGLIIGPIIFFMGSDHGFGYFIWDCFAMAIAVPIVDIIRPTYYRDEQ